MKQEYKNISFLTAAFFICLTQPAFSDQATCDYNDLGRLTSARYADGYNVVTINFNYDDTGNVQKKQVTTILGVTIFLGGLQERGWQKGTRLQ